MKIQLYAREYPPDGTGFNSGLIKAVHGLACGFAQCGADVTVLCENAQDAVLKTKYGYTIRSFAYNNGKPSRRALPKSLVDYVRGFAETRTQPGLFVINAVFNPNNYLLSRLLRKARIPYFVAPHDPYNPALFASGGWKKWPYWYLIEKPLLKHARGIQVLDTRHGEWIQTLGVRTPIMEVINGFDAEDVPAEESLQWRREGTPGMLYLGRMDAHNKGLDLLIDAFADLAKTNDVKLTMQGPDWGDRPSLQKLAGELGLNGNCKFVDPQYDRNASQIAGDHDIFVLPSRFEGFGLAALEAMVAGRVLLVTDNAGIAPHVKAAGCGVVVSPETDQIKAGILQLLSRRSEWKQMGLAGRNYVLSRLRWDRIAADAMDRYRALLSNTPAGVWDGPLNVPAEAVTKR